ncbi:MAG: cytochrome c [Deltaproteobacteria bacterium]|nr:cytochrome c [Deltaproteobacteria bacterium]MCL5276747.1 cytochrome c [Deltaproteobacteria bacterium]
MFKRDSWMLVIGGGLLFALTLVMIYKENNPGWKQYQSTFAHIASLTIGQDRARTIDRGIVQIYVPSLNRVDRCVTCHQGYDIPGMEKAREPFTTHPDLPFMKYHTFSKFGCTICHGGQGYATTVKAAHGLVEHWDEPLLDRNLGEKYGLEQPGHIMEINCNTCHRDNRNVEWMDYINQAEGLVKEKNCAVCHIINGQGGKIGPDLTFEGDKNPELFDFTNIKHGPKTAFNWLYQHFKDPADVTKGSAMPNFGFTDEQARALTMLVLSWKKINLPYEFIPKTGIARAGGRKGTEGTEETRGAKQAVRSLPQEEVTTKTPEQKSATQAPGAGLQAKGKEVFETKGCTACHTIGKGKLVGPDLKGVTKTRTARWLADWLKNTTKMQATDPIAKELLQEYKVPMPQQDLNSEEIDALIDYFRSKDAGE